MDKSWAVVVAQLAERSLPSPDIRNLNHGIGNISNVFIGQLLSRKDKNKEKEARKGPQERPIKKHIMPFRRESNEYDSRSEPDGRYHIMISEDTQQFPDRRPQNCEAFVPFINFVTTSSRSSRCTFAAHQLQQHKPATVTKESLRSSVNQFSCMMWRHCVAFIVVTVSASSWSNPV